MAQLWGLSSVGFRAKDFVTIKSELENQLRNEIDPTLHFGEGSVAGVLTGIVANQARQVWESLSGLYHSLQPHTASGVALDALCSLTGTYRKRAAYSRAKAMVTLESNAIVPKDARVLTVGGHCFKVTAEVKNTTSSKANIEADLQSEEAGTIIANADTIGKIMTPMAGWSAVVFKQTYECGRLAETDDELRIRRIMELRATGSSTADAILARLKQIPQVEAVFIKENARSFEVVIKGGNDQDIANTIWQCKPLSVETSGSVKFEITDSIGGKREIRFSRPLDVHLTLHANIKVRRLLDDGELQALKNALVDFSKQQFSLGSEIYPSRFLAAILQNPAVLDVTTLQVRDRVSGNTAPAVIMPEQIASLAFKDIYLEQIIEVAS